MKLHCIDSSCGWSTVTTPDQEIDYEMVCPWCYLPVLFYTDDYKPQRIKEVQDSGPDPDNQDDSE